MTLKEMWDKLAIYLNDPGKALYTTEQLTSLLNTAYQGIYNELIKRKLYTRKASTTITFTADNQEIAFDTSLSIQKIIAAYDADGVKVDVFDEEYSKQSDVRSVYFKADVSITTLGTRTTATTRADKLGWYVTPSSTFDITVLYAEKLSLLDITDSLGKTKITDIPEEYHDAIVFHAAELAWASKGISPEIERTVLYWAGKFAQAFDSMVMALENQSDTDQHVIDLSASDVDSYA